MAEDPLRERIRGQPGGPPGFAGLSQMLGWGLAALVALTQITAHRLGYPPALGEPLGWAPPISRAVLEGLALGFVALTLAALLISSLRRIAGLFALGAVSAASLLYGPLYPPLRYPLWFLAWKDHPDLGPVVVLPLAVGCLGAALLGFVWIAFRGLPSSGNVHGSSRFATFEEAQHAGLFALEGIVLGRLAGGLLRRWRLLRHAATEHVLFIGYTRSGKTSGCAIPTALDWADHLVVFDPKGAEVWHATAGAKRAAGHRLLRFAPTEPGWARWNPLWEIEPGAEEVGGLQRLAANLISTPARGGGDPHWVLSARRIFVGLALHVLYGEERKSIGRCRDLLMATAGRNPWTLFERMNQTEHDPELAQGWRDPETGEPSATHPEVARLARSLLKTPERELGSMLSTLIKYLEPWADGRVEAATEISDFTLRDLRSAGRPLAIYLTVPRRDVERLAPLLRVFFTSASAALTAVEDYVDFSARSEPGRRTLLVLDEFASLGHMPHFAEMLSVLAGYGVTLLLLIQDYAQLTSTYGRDEPISGGCPYLIATSSSKPETMAYLSKLSGETTVEWTKVSVSSGHGWGFGRRSRSRAEARRPLLTEGEIRTLESDRQLVFAPGLHPILAQKAPYFRARRWRDLADFPAPEPPAERLEIPSPWAFAHGRAGLGEPAGRKKSKFDRGKNSPRATRYMKPAMEAGRSTEKER